MKEEKLEQLEKVFKTTIKDVISKAETRQSYFKSEVYLQNIINSLIYEVKIRINNK